MVLRHKLYLCLICSYCIFILISCASTGKLRGGDPDEDPPELVLEKSTPNFQTNFTPSEIELKFNEWIELKNQQKEILISPPFFTAPKITSRGKKIKVKFPEDEALREDVTYIINFGNSIVDFTEGNIAKGFRFVFATGDKIDSLTFEGKVIDGITGDKIDDIMVMLYDINEDSIVVKEKPFYYIRTGKNGEFKFENLKNDTFKVFVLKDLNFNYKLDPEVEQLAFLDTLFILNDSSNYNPTFTVFAPETSVRVVSSESKVPGRISIIFNKEVDYKDISILYPQNLSTKFISNKDSIRLFYNQEVDSIGLIYQYDTLDFYTRAIDSTFKSRKIKRPRTNSSKEKLAPFDSLTLSFATPIVTIDTSLFILSDKPTIKASTSNTPNTTKSIGDKEGKAKEETHIDLVDTTLNNLDTLVAIENIDSLLIDSLLTDSLTVDSLLIDSLKSTPTIDTVKFYDFTTFINGNKVKVRRRWKEDHDYQLTILPNGLTDLYGRTNDTLIINFKTARNVEFGDIALHIKGMDSMLNYIVHLKLKEETKKREIISRLEQDSIVFPKNRINEYSLEIIEDINQDSIWTTGSYWDKRQPERIKKYKLEKLRENWNLETTIFWEEKSEMEIDSIGTMPDSLNVIDSLNINKLPDDQNKKKKKGGNKEKGKE